MKVQLLGDIDESSKFLDYHDTTSLCHIDTINYIHQKVYPSFISYSYGKGFLHDESPVVNPFYLLRFHHWIVFINKNSIWGPIDGLCRSITYINNYVWVCV